MTKPLILLVDDDIDTLGLMELTLQTAEFEVISAHNGQQALDAVKQHSFDAILLDIMMPDLSGFDVMRILKHELEEVPPFVFLTAKNLPEDRQMGEGLGAAAYLTKPTTRGHLLDAVQAALSSRSGA
ncbi:MAG: response regulator [Anaerolineales bacterium]|nr:response regulator [Anaerolineales bacterium]